MEEEYKLGKKDEIQYYALLYILVGIVASFIVFLLSEIYIIVLIGGTFPRFWWMLGAVLICDSVPIFHYILMKRYIFLRFWFSIA